jgi:hypothetical protein
MALKSLTQNVDPEGLRRSSVAFAYDVPKSTSVHAALK